MEISKHWNPGKIFEQYLQYVPEAESENDSQFLFMQPIRASKSFDVLDPEQTIFYHPKLKVGLNTLGKCLPSLCNAAGVAKATNHQGTSMCLSLSFNM